MGKKNRGKAKKSAAYKPSAGLVRPALDTSMQKMAAEPSKRAKKPSKIEGDDSEEIDKRSSVKATEEKFNKMFEAAKVMKKGVSHIKDLDYSVINHQKSLQ